MLTLQMGYWSTERLTELLWVKQLIRIRAELSLLDVPQETQTSLIGSALNFLFLAKLAFKSGNY